MHDQDSGGAADPPRTPPTNADLARHMAEAADALADYPHLPALFAVHVSLSSVHAYVRNFSAGGQREVAEWAMAFEAPVEFDLTTSIPAIRTAVTLRDTVFRLQSDLTREDATRFGRALGVAVKPGERTKVDAAALLEVLAVQA